MTGRPINEDRQLALITGARTYVGSQHKQCGTTERYVKGNGCVHCARALQTEARNARLAMLGRPIPVPKPKPVDPEAEVMAAIAARHKTGITLADYKTLVNESNVEDLTAAEPAATAEVHPNPWD